ncbi:MAG: sigma-70 family RNA polymerase sigma factor [Butyricicoccus pullicaecorum]|nr:sigma-70 family RNA polymerase sigma factor [Butyricicoccus pullicaecorum]
MTGEKVLLQRAKKGEMAAFESLVTAYERRVYSLALRSTGSEADAADITQEVFLRAYRSLDTFRGESGFSTWLYRITVNLCVDLARKNNPAESLDDEQALEAPETRGAYQPETALANSELRRELDAALSLVSEEHRKIVILRDVAGMSYADIAAALELEEGTVKSRLARARAALRKILIERGNISLPSASKQTERGAGNA